MGYMPHSQPEYKMGIQILGELSISRLSRLLYSSIRAVKEAYLSICRMAWKPYNAYDKANGDLVIEDYKFSFFQVEPDIHGGKGRDSRGNSYVLKGGNILERIRLIPIIDVLGRKIAILLMSFRDEEHPVPYIDKAYRWFRRIAFNRTRDIEAIAIEFAKEHLRIAFLGICSGAKTFASRIGSHRTCIVKTEKTSNSIYVSNVWNHAMATWNTNPDMDLVKIKPELSVNIFESCPR